MRNEEHKRQYMREYMRNYRARNKPVNINGKERKDFTNYGAVTSLALLDEDADETRRDVPETQMRPDANVHPPSIVEQNANENWCQLGDQIPF